MPSGRWPSIAAARSVWRASAVTPAARGPLPQTSPIDEHPLVLAGVEDVVEVAADLVELAGGAVARGDLDARDLGQRVGQQRRLQRVRDPRALGVQARVFDRRAGAPPELLGERDVARAEAPPGLGARRA